MPVQIDKEKTKKILGSVLEKIAAEVDPFLLDEYHRLFKQEVSLFHRSKAAAYLLMLCDQGKTINVSAGINAAQGKPAAAASRAEKKDAPSKKVSLAEEESTRLFFSIGRNRRVFPREIIDLVSAKTPVPREDIGAIRILDNYSFVQVRSTRADAIIEALNGIDFRGRPLTVNFAKSREDAALEQD